MASSTRAASRKRLARGQSSAIEPGQPAWKRALWRRLLPWYAEHARDLPWRRSRDPYRIWVSETMLQQTQVATVIPYYERFLAAFPTLANLAAADEQQVLRLWEGLGYYRRARQLHRAARVIVEKHAGVFPQQFEQVLELPGVGRYTAGAVLSFAFGERLPILEANTIRTYSRLAAYRHDPRSSQGQRQLWHYAEQWLPPRDAGAFNQAMMELGSEVCLPRTPLCGQCPVARLCPTRALGLQQQIPLAARRPATQAVHEVFVVIRHRRQILLLERDEGSRWAGMWDFPRFELAHSTHSAADIARIVNEKLHLPVTDPSPIATLKHGVTRFRITLHCYDAELMPGSTSARLPSTTVLRASGYRRARWIKPASLDQLALSVTARKLARLIAN